MLHDEVTMQKLTFTNGDVYEASRARQEGAGRRNDTRLTNSAGCFDARTHLPPRASPGAGSSAERLHPPRPRQAHLLHWRLVRCAPLCGCAFACVLCARRGACADVPLLRVRRTDGDWRDNQRHGTGVALFVSGLRYEGAWKNDKADGEGACVYPGGDKYSGEWKNDHRRVEAGKAPMWSADAMSTAQVGLGALRHGVRRHVRGPVA
jgi:hypothetical protein